MALSSGRIGSESTQAPSPIDVRPLAQIPISSARWTCVRVEGRPTFIPTHAKRDRAKGIRITTSRNVPIAAARTTRCDRSLQRPGRNPSAALIAPDRFRTEALGKRGQLRGFLIVPSHALACPLVAFQPPRCSSAGHAEGCQSVPNMRPPIASR